MPDKKKILAISGSTRSKSTNEAILSLIASWFASELEVNLYKGIGALPQFNPEVSDEELPASVKEFRELVAGAEGIIICTPEYVFSLPGALKNALEWTVSTTVFSHKPMALLLASASGEKAFEALKLVMRTIEGRVSEEASLLIRGAKGKFSRNGAVLDKQVEEELKEVVKNLLKMISDKAELAKTA